MPPSIQNLCNFANKYFLVYLFSLFLFFEIDRPVSFAVHIKSIHMSASTYFLACHILHTISIFFKKIQACQLFCCLVLTTMAELDQNFIGGILYVIRENISEIIIKTNKMTKFGRKIRKRWKGGNMRFEHKFIEGIRRDILPLKLWDFLIIIKDANYLNIL